VNEKFSDPFCVIISAGQHGRFWCDGRAGRGELAFCGVFGAWLFLSGDGQQEAVNDRS
jgi:hypothetical protein